MPYFLATLAGRVVISNVRRHKKYLKPNKNEESKGRIKPIGTGCFQTDLWAMPHLCQPQSFTSNFKLRILAVIFFEKTEQNKTIIEKTKYNGSLSTLISKLIKLKARVITTAEMAITDISFFVNIR